MLSAISHCLFLTFSPTNVSVSVDASLPEDSSRLDPMNNHTAAVLFFSLVSSWRSQLTRDEEGIFSAVSVTSGHMWCLSRLSGVSWNPCLLCCVCSGPSELAGE